MLYAKRGEAYLKLKRPNAAIASADSALKMNPDSAKAFKVRGMARRMLAQWEAAAADLGTGLNIDFDDVTAAAAKIVIEKAHIVKTR